MRNRPRRFIPRPYQNIIIDAIVSNKRIAIHAGMGLGKTAATLFALSVLLLLEKHKVLVLGPLRVVSSVWEAEAKKWDCLRHLRFSKLFGRVKARASNLREDADIYLLNYENICWLCEACGNNWPFSIIVADESTRLKNFRIKQGGRRAKALSLYAFPRKVNVPKYMGDSFFIGADRFIELTGTPAPNGLLDLWGQYWFLDRGAALGQSFNAFQKRWFFLPPREAYYFVRPKPFPHSAAEISSRIAHLTVSVRAEDWFPDLEKPVITNVPVKLPRRAYAQYRSMEKSLFIEIDNNLIDAKNAAAKSIKCLQIASGAIYTGKGDEYITIHDSKIIALLSIIEEAAGAPILVAYHFKSDLLRIKQRIPYAVDINDNANIIDRWNAGEIPVLLCHPSSAGHGLNLQDGGNILVYFSHWWDLEQRDQIFQRIGPIRQRQSGHKRKVFVYNIIAENTLDHVVLLRHETKREVQDLLLELRSVKS